MIQIIRDSGHLMTCDECGSAEDVAILAITASGVIVEGIALCAQHRIHAEAELRMSRKAAVRGAR